MPTPRVRERVRLLPAAALAAVALLLAAGSQGAAGPAGTAAGASAWRGFVQGGRSEVAVGQRMIVVLRYPSLADRVFRAGGQASESEMRRWTAAALASQKQIAARLSGEGVQLEPEFVYTRTFNGFATALDSRALALLERDPDVSGVYPVRVAYPAAVGPAALRTSEYGPGSGRRAELRLPGLDGAGITIALLDTGVDATHPYLRGRVLEGIDILDPAGAATARHHPEDASQLEHHGTQSAGLLVGRDGPAGLHGAAPGAAVLPIRVAGWQPTADGGHAVYGRTDQLLAGLESAVDPDGDGDVLDAARVAVVGVAEPFAAFAEGPVARAVEGATRLDTLVVAPVGNEGPAGPGYGSVAGPGGAPAALTVGAMDGRLRTSVARVVIRAGLRILFEGELPLGGAAEQRRTLALQVVRPAAEGGGRVDVGGLARFFDEDGFSVVAGRAALLERSAVPADTGRRAVEAGAAAVLVDGDVPAGALGVDERLGIPIVGLAPAVASSIREALARGIPVQVSLGAPHWQDNDAAGRVAPFSSHGLAFGGGVKPELVVRGVELLTADAGRTDGRVPRYGTVSGSSAAAAIAGGAAARVAQARPELDAEALKGVLVGTAVPQRDTRTAAQGAGLLDPGAAVVAEVAAAPATVAFGAAREQGWTSTRTIRIRNVTNRRLRVQLVANVQGIAGVSVSVAPQRALLRAGAEREVELTARVAFLPRGLGAITGAARVQVAGGGEIAIPWAVALPLGAAPLLADVRLSAPSFRASDSAPAVLSVRAGAVSDRDGHTQLQPLARLEVELWRGNNRLGVLARLRNVLPGNYAFGVTGRGPRGVGLAKGPYRLRVVATPPEGEPEAAIVRFRIS